MDFEERYTEAQQAFRAAVRSWLEANAPKGLRVPPDGRPLSPAVQAPLREFLRKIGAQGWLAPSWPREWGGGGLTPALEAVLQEELRQLRLPALGDNRLWIRAVMTWGTPEQQRAYVVPALRGETITWMAFSEPEAGSDLSTINSTAVREGDSYVISGIKGWVTGRFDPDYLCTLAVTDRTRPPRMNLGFFVVPARLAGITIKNLDLLVGSERVVHFDGVRVPAECLIGTPYTGWEIAQSMLEQERGGYPARMARRETLRSVLGEEQEES